jgi:hypothetical protein
MSASYPALRPPDWTPLQRALAGEFGTHAVDAIGAFWFIGFVPGPADVGELRLYEHRATRRRIALDRRGGAYCWYEDTGGYGRTHLGDALVNALV